MFLCLFGSFIFSRKLIILLLWALVQHFCCWKPLAGCLQLAGYDGKDPDPWLTYPLAYLVYWWNIGTQRYKSRSANLLCQFQFWFIPYIRPKIYSMFSYAQHSYILSLTIFTTFVLVYLVFFANVPPVLSYWKISIKK